MSDAPPKYAYVLVVVGADRCPPWYVWERLDRLTARVRDTHRLDLILRDSAEAREWAHAQADRVGVLVEPVERGRYAEPKWAMACAALAHGVLVFGDERPYWRLTRYAREVGATVRVVPVPPPDARPAPRQVIDRDGLPPDPLAEWG